MENIQIANYITRKQQERVQMSEMLAITQSIILSRERIILKLLHIPELSEYREQLRLDNQLDYLKVFSLLKLINQ